jgi:hypothetical protein
MKNKVVIAASIDVVLRDKLREEAKSINQEKPSISEILNKILNERYKVNDPQIPTQ